MRIGIDLGGTKTEIINLNESGEQRLRHRIATVRADYPATLRSLHKLVNNAEQEVIVLGSGLSNIESLYTEVPKLWPRYVFSEQISTRLVPNRHCDSSGVWGAAWPWPAGAQIP